MSSLQTPMGQSGSQMALSGSQRTLLALQRANQALRSSEDPTSSQDFKRASQRALSGPIRASGSHRRYQYHVLRGPYQPPEALLEYYY